MKKLKETLAFLGFSELETKVYLKLLHLKESTASRLGKELKIHRRTAYDVAERLVKKGLLTCIKKGRIRHYKPVLPLRILHKLREMEREIKEKREELGKVLPKIEKTLEGERIDVKVLFGRKGIETLYLDELKEGKTIHVICTTIDRTEELLKHFLPKFTKERLKKRILIRMIATRKDKKYLEKYKLLRVRHLHPRYVSPASIAIYGKKAWNNPLERRTRNNPHKEHGNC